jgi:hypothetical protein
MSLELVGSQTSFTIFSKMFSLCHQIYMLIYFLLILIVVVDLITNCLVNWGLSPKFAAKSARILIK